MRARYSSLRLILLGVACSLVLSASVSAQAAYTPAFDVELVTRRAETSTGPESRLDVYTAVPNSSLRFLARQGGFEASYAVTVQVYSLDDRGNHEGLVVSRTFERDVAAADYDQTQDADLEDRAVQSLAVAPGRYAVEVAIEDGSSGRALSLELGHVVRDMTGDGVVLSDPLLLSGYDPAAGSSTPVVGSTISTEMDEFWVSYDLHTAAPTELQVTYVVTEQNQVRDRPSFGALLGPGSSSAGRARHADRRDRAALPRGRPHAGRVPCRDRGAPGRRLHP